ncbi:RNA-binding S4 domain-containing protein [Mycoplasmatota bacterium]|nr:RNA-binding S4 domain-containing protein [Mycoplasmatota bacterium]
MIRKVFIHTEYITLGQLLKFENILESGGLVKDFLNQVLITVNNEPEKRRGKKLYHGDIVKIKDLGTYEIIKNGD